MKSKFRDAAGALVDPTTTTIKAESPDEIITTNTLNRVSIGVYEYDLLLNKSGRWSIALWSTGAGAAAFEDTVSVDPSELLP